MSIGNVDLQLPNTGAVTTIPQPTNVEVEMLAKKALNNPQATSEQLAQKMDKSNIKQLTNNLNEILDSFNIQAKFSVHEVTNDVIVKLVDTSSGVTIREFPSRKMLDIVAKILQLAGLLVDEKV